MLVLDSNQIISKLLTTFYWFFIEMKFIAVRSQTLNSIVERSTPRATLLFQDHTGKTIVPTQTSCTKRTKKIITVVYWAIWMPNSAVYWSKPKGRAKKTNYVEQPWSDLWNYSKDMKVQNEIASNTFIRMTRVPCK